MANKDDKVKFSITSDGTSKGTKITLNGKNILEDKCVAMCSFDAQAAAAYPSWDGDMRQNPENIQFSYMSIDKNDKGEKIYTKYKFNLAEDKYEPVITPLGQAAPEGDGGYVEDNLIGKDSAIITEILSYSGNSVRYVPSREILITRTQESLKDTLEDLKKDF
jgi:hypothetical protein